MKKPAESNVLQPESQNPAAKNPGPKGGTKPFFATKTDYSKLLLLAITYSAVIVCARWMGLLIRFEFHPPAEHWAMFRQCISWILGLELAGLFLLGQFHSLLSYFSLPDVRRIGLASGGTALISLGVWYYTGGGGAPPRSIILLGFVFDVAGLTLVRILFRTLREWQRGGPSVATPRRMVIIGAGDVGANLAREIKSRWDLRMQLVGFFDDDPAKWNKSIHGVRVFGPPELLLDNEVRADEAVIAMPSASGKRIRDVVKMLGRGRIRSATVPSFEQMVSGKVRVSQIRPVQLEDLLGRQRVSLETARIQDLIRGRVVMVTGAGGSIGSELCRQLMDYQPARLLLVERCEVQMFQVEQQLLGLGSAVPLVPLVADILDEQRLRGIMGAFHPQIVFHAAAHKHVPMMESQPFEAFRNNSIGTKQLVDLAAEFGVDRFVLISTDKAINPTNVMGATKRLAELYLQAKQQQPGLQTKFMAVRFGNVLGSSGSVIPTFKKQIEAGGPVTVTHPEVTRYFMTIQEAVGLVLQSATQGQGGEIFVLDMGNPVKIVEIAQQLIELSGLQPGTDIAIQFTGLRPGEKLYEELNHDTENMVMTDHPKIMRFIGVALPHADLQQGLQGILGGASADALQVKREIQRLVPEYKPYQA